MYDFDLSTSSKGKKKSKRSKKSKKRRSRRSSAGDGVQQTRAAIDAWRERRKKQAEEEAAEVSAAKPDSHDTAADSLAPGHAAGGGDFRGRAQSASAALDTDSDSLDGLIDSEDLDDSGAAQKRLLEAREKARSKARAAVASRHSQASRSSSVAASGVGERGSVAAVTGVAASLEGEGDGEDAKTEGDGEGGSLGAHSSAVSADIHRVDSGPNAPLRRAPDTEADGGEAEGEGEDEEEDEAGQGQGAGGFLSRPTAEHAKPGDIHLDDTPPPDGGSGGQPAHSPEERAGAGASLAGPKSPSSQAMSSFAAFRDFLKAPVAAPQEAETPDAPAQNAGARVGDSAPGEGGYADVDKGGEDDRSEGIDASSLRQSDDLPPPPPPPPADEHEERVVSSDGADAGASAAASSPLPSTDAVSKAEQRQADTEPGNDAAGGPGSSEARPHAAGASFGGQPSDVQATQDEHQEEEEEDSYSEPSGDDHSGE